MAVVGNAKVAGLEKDLGMAGFDLNIALTIFYIFVSTWSFAIRTKLTWGKRKYNASDIPSNLLLKHFGSRWLAFLVFGFGVVSLFSAFMTTYGGLIASRVFLGITEGGTLVSPNFVS
jgi:MFS family permease